MVESRKRRIVKRLAIALALAAIILFADWYFTQGVDQRLVGTWSVTSTSPQRSGDIWRVGPYGRAAVYHQTNQKRIVGVQFSWKVRGTTIEFLSFNNKRTFATSIKREWELLWGKITTGQASDDVSEHYEIVDIGPDEISLKYLEGNEQITLRRLSE